MVLLRQLLVLCCPPWLSFVLPCCSAGWSVCEAESKRPQSSCWANSVLVLFLFWIKCTNRRVDAQTFFRSSQHIVTSFTSNELRSRHKKNCVSESHIMKSSSSDIMFQPSLFVFVCLIWEYLLIWKLFPGASNTHNWRDEQIFNPLQLEDCQRVSQVAQAELITINYTKWFDQYFSV